MKLLIVNGSTRQAQASERVAKWVENNAKSYQLDDVEFETVDLRDFDLPLFDEPVSPMMNENRVTDGGVKRWLDALAGEDGYVIITPEYNHAMSNSLKNAIDFIDYQIMKKPFIVVGHGGVGGARAIENVKMTLNANIGAVPVPNSVNVFGYVGYQELISEAGEPNEEVKKQEGPLKGAIETLAWYAGALKTAREQ